MKHLRLCDVILDLDDQRAFTRTLKSLKQLEEQDIIHAESVWEREFTLNLPVLTSIRLEDLDGIERLALDTPRLKKARFVARSFSPKLDIVDGKSIESLIISDLANLAPKAMKKLNEHQVPVLRQFSKNGFNVSIQPEAAERAARVRPRPRQTGLRTEAAIRSC